MKTHQLINQTSGKVEYYTPHEIITAARLVMGGIDLDPASSEAANRRIGAKRFYTQEQDGLSLPWSGRIWLNHPFGRVQNPLWIEKAIAEVHRGELEQLCCITFAATSEAWFQPLLRQMQCFLHPRTNYLMPDGSVFRGVTKGSVVTYFGRNLAGFVKHFSPMGVVK